MKMSELIKIEDRDEFNSVLEKSKLSVVEKVTATRSRWEYLYQKYRPSQGHIDAMKDYNRKRGG